MSRARNNKKSPAERPREDRLNSWKAIAAYLKRDVSTVQRWEKREGLPVHRHGHRKGATAYAYRSEIDGWLEVRSLPPVDTSAPHVSLRTFRAKPLSRPFGIAAAGAVLAALVLWTVVDWLRVATNFDGEPVRVLVSGFSTPEGDAEIARAAEEIIASTLSASAKLAVVQREAITETLALMRKAADASMDTETALELAQRQHDIRAVLQGRIERLNGSDVLIVDLRDPGEGIVIAAMSEVLDGDHVDYGVIDGIAARVRDLVEGQATLLERLPKDRLERVTTASLDALKLYSRAMQSSVSDADPTAGNWRAIELLLRQALTYDDDFPSARILLAWAIHNQSFGDRENARDEYLDLAESAVAGADDVSPEEGYFIRGSYQLMLDNDSGAVDELLQLAQLDPDHYWGINNLAQALDRMGRRRAAAEYHARRADLRPGNAYFSAVAAGRLAEIGEDNRAASYSSRARSILDDPSSPASQNLARIPYWDAQLMKVDRFWNEGDIEALLDELDVHAEMLGSLDWADRNVLAPKLARLYLVVGKVRSARQVAPPGYAGSPIMPSSHFAAAVDTGGTGQLAGSDGRPPAVSNATWLSLYNEAFWLARIGQFEEASQALTRAQEQRAENAPLTNASGVGGPFVRMGLLAEAEILFARGQFEAAEELLRELVGAAVPSRETVGFLAAESLASLYAMRGEEEKAVKVLEQWGGSQTRRQIDYETVGVFWMRNRLKLSELLREATPFRATSLEEELRSLLAHADEEHYVAKRLRQRDELAL